MPSQGFVNVREFGALGLPGVDDTAAFQAAHNAAAANNAAVYAPTPITSYNLAGTVAARAPMFGDGSDKTIINSTSPTADVFQIASCNAPSIRDLHITASVPKVAGSFIATSGVNWIDMSGLLLTNWFSAITMGGPAGTYYHIRDCYLQTSVGGGYGINIATAGNAVDVALTNVLIGGAVTGAQPIAGVQVSNVGDLTMNHVSTVKAGAGLNVAPGSGQVIQALLLDNCYFDSGASTGININASGSGVVQLVRASQTWSCTNAHGMVLGGAGAIQDVEIHNCVLSNNAAGHGLIINTPTATSVRVMGGSFSANAYGITTAANVKGYQIIGATCGPAGQFAGNSQYGLNIGAGNDDAMIALCNLQGNGVGPAIIGAPGANFIMRGNRGFATRQKGLATLNAASTATAVNHGLPAAPGLTDIRLTNVGGWGSAGQFYATGPTPSQFSIMTAANPGPGVFVAWEAAVWGG